MKKFYDPIFDIILKFYKAEEKFLRPNSYSNFIRLLTDFYREGKYRKKIWTTHFPIFCYKGLTVNFVDFVP